MCIFVYFQFWIRWASWMCSVIFFHQIWEAWTIINVIFFFRLSFLSLLSLVCLILSPRPLFFSPSFFFHSQFFRLVTFSIFSSCFPSQIWCWILLVIFFSFQLCFLLHNLILIIFYNLYLLINNPFVLVSASIRWPSWWELWTRQEHARPKKVQRR